MGSNGLPPKVKKTQAILPPAPTFATSKKNIEVRPIQKGAAMSALVTLAMLGMAVNSTCDDKSEVTGD